MDNQTIKMYKDGNDIVVVFKNASDDLLSVIRKALEVQLTPVVVPDLEAPPEYFDEPPVDLSNAECLNPTHEIQTFSDFIDTLDFAINTQFDDEMLMALLGFYESHDKIKADVISTLALPRVKGFLHNCYRLDKDLMAQLESSQYSTIEVLTETLPESELRQLAKRIGDRIVSFFEGT